MNAHTFRPFMRCAFAATALSALLVAPLMAVKHHPPAGDGAAAAPRAYKAVDPREEARARLKAIWNSLLTYDDRTGLSLVDEGNHAFNTYLQDHWGIDEGAAQALYEDLEAEAFVDALLAADLPSPEEDEQAFAEALLRRTLLEISARIIGKTTVDHMNGPAVLPMLFQQVLAYCQKQYVPGLIGASVFHRTPVAQEVASSNVVPLQVELDAHLAKKGR